MTQAPLFHESLAEALRTAAMAIGGLKKAGVMLWPELSADRAGRDLSDCLQADATRKLSLDQVELLIRAGRSVGCHAPLAYLCQSNDYEAPVTCDPETEVQRLQREYIAATAALVKLASRIEQRQTEIQSAPTLRRVA